MLELIGLIVLIYFAVKYLPDILLFFIKLILCLVAIGLLIDVFYWVFSINSPVIIIGL